MKLRVVFDTSVLVAAARSRRGASFSLVNSIPSEAFEICLSVGLYSEWQDVLTRAEHLTEGRSAEEAVGFLRYLASQAWLQEVYFLWRPYLADPEDDMILELALAAGCTTIVTHNVGHFVGVERFGIFVVTPGAFLALIRKAVRDG